MKFNEEATLIISGKVALVLMMSNSLTVFPPPFIFPLSLLFLPPPSVASYDASTRVWDCRSRSQDPVQMMAEAKDSVTSLQISNYEILTGWVQGGRGGGGKQEDGLK